MPEVTASRYLTQATWDDVPHLSEKAKAELLASMLPHQRDARSRGIPSLGSGAIYTTPLSDVIVQPFAIPAFWPRAFATDVGWKTTANLWGAWDLSVDTIYIYAEHVAHQQPPSVIANAIKARGAWIRGVMDPAARGRQQADGMQIIEMYRAAGLDVTPADNRVVVEPGQEAGIYGVHDRLSTGRLKFFSTLRHLPAEYRLYRRDEKGRIVKEKDHCMDALRYLVASGYSVARVAPVQGKAPAAIHADYTAGY